LMARDAQLESREGLAGPAGVPQGAHDRVAALAPRVRELQRQWTGASAVEMAATTAVPADGATTAVPAEAAAPATRPPAEPSPAGESSKPPLDELSAFGLPPLRAFPTDPVPVPLPLPPPLPESPLQWSAVPQTDPLPRPLPLLPPLPQLPLQRHEQPAVPRRVERAHDIYGRVDRGAGLRHVASASVEQAAVAEHVPSAQLHEELLEWWYNGGNSASKRLRKERAVRGDQIIGWLGPSGTTGHELDGRMARIRAMCMEQPRLAERAERVVAEQVEEERKTAERAAAAKVAAERASVQLGSQLEQPERPASFDEWHAYHQMNAWSDQLPDNPRVLHGDTREIGSSSLSIWDGQLAAADMNSNQGLLVRDEVRSVSPPVWDGSITVGGRSIEAQKREAEKRRRARKAAEAQLSARRRASAWKEKKEREEQDFWQQPGNDYDLYIDMYGG